jgi:hypothetical protein
MDKDNKLSAFEEIFGCAPKDFDGSVFNYPYANLEISRACYDKGFENLLEDFGICSWCVGSGEAYSECCNGHNCDCGGQPIGFTCPTCGGTGKLDKVDYSTQINYLRSWSERTGGYIGNAMPPNAKLSRADEC